MSGRKIINGRFDAVVVGAGPAGVIAAILLARNGLKTASVGVGSTVDKSNNATRRSDPRTSALMQGAIRLLDRIGAWEQLQPFCAPLQRLRLVDATDWSVKAPTVEFDAAEIGSDPFGWNIPNAELTRILETLVGSIKSLTRCSANVSAAELAEQEAHVETTQGDRLYAPLIVAADGRTSLCRDAAGIATTTWSYPQSAIACSFEHEKPHNDTSIEFHRPSGPLTLVPLPGNRSSLVWVEEPDVARSHAEMETREFEAMLLDKTSGVLGSISNTSARGVFGLSGLTAKSFSNRNVALVGEAAHVLPPIGAQGLNLGIRDAAVLAELLSDNDIVNSPAALEAALANYDRNRRRDVVPRTALVDMLNRSLFSGAASLQGLRGAGLHMLDKIGPLRREFMRRGMEPAEDLPKIMRSDC